MSKKCRERASRNAKKYKEYGKIDIHRKPLPSNLMLHELGVSEVVNEDVLGLHESFHKLRV